MHTRLSLCFLLLVALLAGPASAADTCVVLQYHHVAEDTPASTSIGPTDFERHLELIEELGMQVMPLRRVISALYNRQPLPERCVALTFDDAYASVYRNAWPLLRRRGWPFTLFVPTEAVDLGLFPYMSWGQLRELAAAGVGIESHGHRHSHLIRRRDGESPAAWRERVRRDIEQARQRIASETGQAPMLFAWPYGEYLPELSGILQASGLTGFGQQSGPLSARLGWLAQPRFPVSGAHADLERLRIKLLSRPLPLVRADPASPLPPVGEFRPALTLELEPSAGSDHRLNCFVDGSPNVTMDWSGDSRVVIRPNFDLPPGRNRSNCTLPAGQPGIFHWYSHPWFIRKADGSWYAE